MMIKYLLSTAATITLLTACDPASEVQAGADVPNQTTETSGDGSQLSQADLEAESARLISWLDEVYDAELEFSPESKTQLGIIDDDYGLWNDRSDEAIIAANDRTQGYLEALRSDFDLTALTPEGQLSYRFAEYEWEMNIRLFGHRSDGYVFSPIQDQVSGVVTFMINNHQVGSISEAEAYVSRLEGVGEVIDTFTEEALERAENGVRLPLFAYPRLRAAASSHIQNIPFADSENSSPLHADYTGKFEALDIEEEARAALIESANAAMINVVGPAIQRYLDALTTMEAEADDQAGIWKTPNGEAYYQTLVDLFTTQEGMSPADIHELGLAEVERIQGEMRAIMAEVGFEGSILEYVGYLQTNPDSFYSNDEEGRQGYLEDSAAIIDSVMDRAPEFFNTLPVAPLEVRAVESWRAATAPGAFYNGPALDGSRPGYYYVNLGNMGSQPKYLMESLAYHEGAPGHHFQIALARELTGLPKMQSRSVYSAYVEGWGLYAELLGKDMGFFTNPEMDFGRLTYEIFRAARLVVDTGIHHHQWTRDEAIDYMANVTGIPRPGIVNEVERYITFPGQALSYKIGMISILNARQEAMDTLGEDFDWGGFHDAVLTGGNLPLPIMEDRVETWVQSVLDQNEE